MDNKLNVQKFEANKHYGDICSWWVAENWPIIPLTHLSNNGYVAYVNDTPAMAGWFYQTDSAFCIFEFMVANPEIRHEERALAFKALAGKIKDLAREFGFKSIYSSIRNPSLINRMEKEGFQAQDKTTEMIFNFSGGM